MALTNKQTAARIVKHMMKQVMFDIDGMGCKSIASVAEKTRLSEDKTAEVKKYAKAFLKPILDRVNKVTSRIDD